MYKMESEKIDIIIDLLHNLESSLNTIELRLDRIEENGKSVEKNCVKMSDHIAFIENTYEIVRTPLNYLKNRIEYVMGRNNPTMELPTIQNTP